MCSGCQTYAKNSAYVQNNPHCDECRKFGKRSPIRNTGDFTGNVWNCLQSNFLPAGCSKTFANCDQYGQAEKNACTKHYNLKRVLEEEDEEEEEEESSEERKLDANCPFTNGMSTQCRNWLTSGGQCKSGKKAKCIMCSGCQTYAKNSAYVQNNPHCDECRKFGKRSPIRNTGDFTGNVWNCLQSNFLPAGCSKTFANCDQYGQAEKNACTKHYNLKRVLEEEDEEEAL